MPDQANRDLLSGDLTEHIIEIRQRRRWIEEQWLRAHSTWMAQDIDSRFRSGDSSPNNYYVPFVRKAIERTIVRAVKLLTPNVKWFEVAPIGEVDDERLSNVDNFMWYILRKRIRSRSNISQLVRSLVLYNRCHLKTMVTVKNGQVWPAQRVVDPFSFYTFPETAVSIDEADFVFEDFLISYERYRSFVNKGIVEAIDPTELTKPDWPYHLVERLAHQGITEGGNVGGLPEYSRSDKVKQRLDKTVMPYVALTEVWLTRNDQLHQCYIAWNCERSKIVGFIESPYDEPLYKSAVQRALPSEAYTNSLMDDVIPFQGIANDQLNQFQDAVDREQGMVFAAAGKRRQNWKFGGGNIWEMEDPKEDAVFVTPGNSSNNQLRAWQITLGLINAMGATGTIAEGQPGRNMPRAGNAVQSLISLGMADTQDISELIEQEVLTPSLGDIYKVSAQFIPEHQLIKIPGAKGLFGGSAIMKRAQILGDYEFEWVGSLQFQDEQIRAQRMMIFLNMLPQLTPLLQQQGHAFNLVELIQNIWRYSLGERSLQKIVMPIEELQKQMTMEQAQRAMESMQKGEGQPGMNQNGQGQQPQSSGEGMPSGPSKGIGGLSYSLPTVTNGFVDQ